MAGRPWEERLCLSIQGSFCYSLCLTLEACRSLVSLGPDDIDVLVMEAVWALALYGSNQVRVASLQLSWPAGRSAHPVESCVRSRTQSHH